MTVQHVGRALTLRSVEVLSAGAVMRADDELPQWAPPRGDLNVGFDPAIFTSLARVRVEITCSADDASYAVRAELLCEFEREGEGHFGPTWPVDDGYAVISAVWPQARAALQAAAFSIDRRLPLAMLAPEPLRT